MIKMVLVNGLKPIGSMIQFVGFIVSVKKLYIHNKLTGVEYIIQSPYWLMKQREKKIPMKQRFKVPIFITMKHTVDFNSDFDEEMYNYYTFCSSDLFKKKYQNLLNYDEKQMKKIKHIPAPIFLSGKKTWQNMYKPPDTDLFDSVHPEWWLKKKEYGPDLLIWIGLNNYFLKFEPYTDPFMKDTLDSYFLSPKICYVDTLKKMLDI